MEMKRDDPRIRDLDLVRFNTMKDAIRWQDRLNKLPRQHFLQSSLLCRVDGIDYLAMEKSYIYPSPAPKHLQLNAIGHILLMAVRLDLMGILHANLLRTRVVAVNNLPKLNCLPLTLPNLDSYRTMFIRQQEQICELVDDIVGYAELTNPLYVDFRYYLCNCKDLVDYQSMYKHPYMTEPNDLPFYHIDCSLIWTCNIIKRRKFNEMFNFFTWISKVEEEGHPDIVDMLTSRILNGEVIEYRDTPFDMHVFIHNTMKHVNTPLPIRFWSVEAIHEQIQLLFPNYVLQMFTFMHSCGMNSHFGPEHYAFKFLEHVTNIDESGDGRLCIPRLVEALRFLYYLLAKFYWLSNNRDCDMEVRAIATSLGTCIRILQNVEEIHYECDLSKKKPFNLSEVEGAVFSSIRLIYGAVSFAYRVVKEVPTNQNVVLALQDTSKRFQMFSGFPLLAKRDILRLSRIQWPGVEDVMKILGVNFILMKNDWQVSYLEKLKEMGERLVQMLKI